MMALVMLLRSTATILPMMMNIKNEVLERLLRGMPPQENWHLAMLHTHKLSRSRPQSMADWRRRSATGRSSFAMAGQILG
eukprot:3913308-Pleurochrysis_carterae.AAC.1